MPYHITSYIISYHHIISSYHVISYHTIPYHISRHITLYHIIHHITSYHISSYHITSHILYHIIYRIISYPIVQHIISYHIYKKKCDRSQRLICQHWRLASNLTALYWNTYRSLMAFLGNFYGYLPNVLESINCKFLESQFVPISATFSVTWVVRYRALHTAKVSERRYDTSVCTVAVKVTKDLSGTVPIQASGLLAQTHT